MADRKLPQEQKKKGFLARIFEKLDQKMEERAKKAAGGSCCCSVKDKKEGPKCC